MTKRILALVSLAAILAVPAPRALAQEFEGKDVEIKVGNKMDKIKDVKEWLDGDDLSVLDRSKVYAFDIWSTQTQACKRTVPYLSSLYQELKPKGVVIIGIATDKPKTVRNYMKDKTASMTYPLGSLQKDDEDSAGEDEGWRLFARHSGALPATIVVNRAGQICYVGTCQDDKFERILRLCVTDRYDTDLNAKMEPMLAAARRAAKVRNYKEAQRIYEEIVKLAPRNFTDIGLECWRMISEKVLDEKAAAEYLRGLISTLKSDEPSQILIGNFLATNPEIKTRDLEAAKIVAANLKAMGDKEAENLACRAAIMAATGDLSGASDTQFAAWMKAHANMKARMKRSLDNYRAGVAQPDPESVTAPPRRPDSDSKESGVSTGTTSAPAKPGETKPK